jgi:hypothetical protein
LLAQHVLSLEGEEEKERALLRVGPHHGHDGHWEDKRLCARARGDSGTKDAALAAPHCLWEDIEVLAEGTSPK